jgi:hypothetical protein
MTGYSPTHIPIPKNHADFERKATVLFREILKDPAAKRLGREGQAQYGIDIIGYAAGNTSRIVGIQCKKKTPNQVLTAKEVRDEVRKALKYKPAIYKYIIITTAPKDRKLEQLAQTLTQAQKAKGRKIKIEVWGWDLLEDRIDEYPAARNVFDPAWSPSVKETQQSLKQIKKSQTKQATAEQVEKLSEKFEQRSLHEDRVPSALAEELLEKELLRINARRGFFEANAALELEGLANRVVDGDLAKAPGRLRAEALERAARTHAQPNTVAKAKKFHVEALKLNGQLDTSFFDALLPAAEGDPKTSLRALKQLGTPQAKSAIFNQLFRLEGNEKALEWCRKSGLKITDLDPGGAQNLLVKRTVVRDYETALQEAQILPDSYLRACPALRSLRANLLLTSILPAAHRPILFEGMAINPRMLQFASVGNSQAVIGKAQADLDTVLSLTPELKLVHLTPLLEEQVLWLQLEQTTTRSAAEARIAEEIKDPAKTLRRVRLALAYKIPFNQEALTRHLDVQKDVGDWTEDEQFAAFLLAWHNSDPTKLAEFFDLHRDDLFRQAQLSSIVLASIEIEALSRAGRFADARRRLKEHRKQYFDAETAAQLDTLISSVEKGDEAERLRQLYEAGKNFTHLQLLVNTLVRQNDHRQLAIYAPVLLRESKRVEDYDVAQRALYISHQYLQVVALAAEFPDLHKLNDDFLALEGWSSFHLGRVTDARVIARALVARRADANDRELDINTAIESGDWGYLQAVITREASRTAALDVKALLRLARMAFESSSFYVDRFRDAAIAAAPDRPEVFLAAYQLSVDRGDDQDPRAYEWLQKAVVLSGPEGPIQRVNIKDVIDRSSGWNKKADNVSTMTANVQIPLYMAARALNRQPVDFILGLALRNAKATNPKQQFPVLAYSGAKGPVDLSGVRRLALDVTSIFTLEYLGLLKKTIEAFDEIIIAPTTLSSLFFDRQFIRFQQPSQVLKARKIKHLITTGKLKVLKNDTSDAAKVSSEIDPELQMLLEKAAVEGATVIRSAPVAKLGSFLEETADVSAFSNVLTDTHSVLNFLKGKIAAPVAANAQAYLSHVDSGWAVKPELTPSSTVYLDQLTVTYLHQVDLLEVLTGSVAQVYVSPDVDSHSDAVISAAESSEELLQRVEHIRATLNEAIEKGSNVKFSSRRPLGRARKDEDEDFGGSSPSLDIMSDLSEVDVVVCDDRFLNKETFWADGKRQVPCASTLDVIDALNGRAVISEQQKFDFRHQLRIAGYYAVPFDPAELLSALNRAGMKDGGIEETPELTAFRLNLTLPARAKMFSESELPWLDHARAAIHGVIRTIWSSNDTLESVTARADWLLAIRPTPLAWITDLTDNAKWAVAAQKTASQIGLSLLAPYSQRAREKEYGEWIELRLARPYRIHQPELWAQSLEALVAFLKGLLKPDADIPKEIRGALVLRLVDALHPSVKSDFLNVQGAAASLGISVARIVTLNGTESVDLKSFNACLRAALAGRKNAEILLANGSKVEAKLSVKSTKTGGKTAIIEFNGGRFAFGNVDLLANAKSARVSALRRVFSEGHLSEREEAAWFSLLKKEPLADVKYAELMDCLHKTPERFAESVAKPQTLGPDIMVPTDLTYFERFVGPIPDQTTFEGYLAGSLAAFQQELIRSGSSGLRKLAYSGLSQRLIPLQALRSVSVKQIAALLDASDPFTLVFGFELCRDRLAEGGRGFEALGTKFLQRLLPNDAWLKGRCEIFAACAVVTMVHLRPSANASSVRLYWYRLAVLAHAGLLADALRTLPKTEGFLKWAIENFGGAYTWHTAVDAREEPRWESDWIDPTALRSELIGRCANALWMLPETERPKLWSTLISKALDSVTPTWAAFFPGPLDGFLPVGVSPQRKADVKKVKSLLKKRSSFKQAPGLMVIAYGGGIDASLTKEILRLLEGSGQQLSKLNTAHQILRCCAYIAATNKDTQLAGAVINRCLRLVTSETSANSILALMLVAI